jgi:hypothetical protein
MPYSSNARILIKEQLAEWDLAQNNYNGLKKVRTKQLALAGGAIIKVQFNPERIRSSSAKVDKESINKRPCFLCDKNRPKEQRGLPFSDNYTILVNPFPIFSKHLTIPQENHIEQLIKPHFNDMLKLAKELQDFTIFYNGPRCGASAPDHFHLQAGIKGFLPIEEDYRSGKFTKIIGKSNGVQFFSWHNYNRGIITLKSALNQQVEVVFQQLYSLLKNLQPNEVEPMLNILAYYEGNQYIVHVFPRILHRPACYFAQGKEQILLSPASVDLGGVFITPREDDFEKITANDIVSILNQVCMRESDVIDVIEKVLRNI